MKINEKTTVNKKTKTKQKKLEKRKLNNEHDEVMSFHVLKKGKT